MVFPWLSGCSARKAQNLGCWQILFQQFVDEGYQLRALLCGKHLALQGLIRELQGDREQVASHWLRSSVLLALRVAFTRRVRYPSDETVAPLPGIGIVAGNDQRGVDGCARVCGRADV